MTSLKEIRAMCDEATPGPWRWFGNTGVGRTYLGTPHGGRLVVLDSFAEHNGPSHLRFRNHGRCVMVKAVDMAEVDHNQEIQSINQADAKFIAAARTIIPDLLDEIEKLQYKPKDYTAEDCEAVADNLTGDDLELYNHLRLEAGYLNGIRIAQEDIIEKKDKRIAVLEGDEVSGE